MLLINCSNRERNCFSILKELQKEDDKLISLSNKKMDFCLGCQSCRKELPKHCVLDDYITNNVYDEILKEDNIIFASPIYMNNINGILKNLLDRFKAFNNYELLRGKKFYLIMAGCLTKEENKEEIKRIIEYFKGITEFMCFDFEFLDYFVDSEDLAVKKENDDKIRVIKEKLNQ